MKIGIVGAGITGLAAAWRLQQAGHQIVVYDKSDRAGGLAAGFKDEAWEWPLEFHYHHLFKSDHAVLKLAKELGINTFFNNPKTSLWYKNKIIKFDGPKEVLTFPWLSWPDKLKLAWGLVQLKVSPAWKPLEAITAKQWILQHMGAASWRVIWEPLFRGKFGNDADRVSAAWFWARIHKRSSALGYFEGGFQALADGLTRALRQADVDLRLGVGVQSIYGQSRTKVSITSDQGEEYFDRVIVAAPSPVLLKLLHGLPQHYVEKLQWLRGIGSVTLVLALKQQLMTDNTYWLNVNKTDVPILAVVEHTNMIDSHHYGGDHLIYVGNYWPQDHRHFSLSAEELIQEFQPYLREINPQFSINWVRKSWVFKAPFTQPIILPNYSDILPSMETPVPHVWWVSMQHVYPWDRGTNYAVEWGEKVVDLVLKS